MFLYRQTPYIWSIW